VKVISAENGRAHIELTRRNLTALLQKLDAGESRSDCTLVKQDDLGMIGLVTVVEDDAHYSDRPAGPMRNPETGEIW
jgi:hypothetical protein